MLSILSITPFIRQSLFCTRPALSGIRSQLRYNSYASSSTTTQPPVENPVASDWNNGEEVKKRAVSPLTIDEIWKEKSTAARNAAAERPPANAYSGWSSVDIFRNYYSRLYFVGRSVLVMNGNVADAYQKLNSILGRNKVRAQLRRAERHEKKGEKRRRLSSERWRRQFAHEV
jgi:small subunit ribosomal protein MRP21